MQPSVFISYRRADTGGHAGRLFDRLSCWFDAGEVFFDVDTFDAGDVFPERIERAIRAAKVVLVVIGPGWLEELNTRAAGRQPDYVRQEVAAAIQRQTAGEGVLVLPVLMGGAGMPSREALHPDLRGEIGRLSDYQAHTFQGNQADWDHQLVRLREAIARVGGVPKPRFRSPSEVEQPYHVLDDLLSFHFQDPENRLQKLYESLEARSGVAAVARSALHGMGGVGKTQLALKYTLDYRDRYAGVWWFRAESEGALQADAGKLCEHAKVLVPDGERPSQALKRWLEREEGRWLLVFDNAAEPDALRPHLPRAGNHHSIVTSRNPVWGGIAAPVELDTWTTEQGVRFLAGRLSGGDREEPAALVEDLGGLPLALEQAASYLEATGVTAGVYRRLLDGVDTEGDILDETEGSSATGYGRSVAKTLSVAFEKLSPPARRLLRLCALAAPEPVPEWLFREAGDLLPDSLADTVGDNVAWNRIVAELRRYGLAGRISDEETGHALVLHRLTQQVVRTRLAEPAEDCGVLQAVLASACTGDPGHPDHWSRYAALAEHVIQLDRLSPHGSLGPGKIVRLLNRVALFLRFRSARYTDAVRLRRRAVDIASRQWGDSHRETLANMNNLALTLRARGDQGDLGEARELQERALEGCLRVSGEEHPDTLTSMGNLASTLYAQSDLGEARALQERVLEARRRVSGEEHPDTLTSMNNLAATLSAQGDLRGARALQERVLEARRRVLGEEHPDTLMSMNNLAPTLHAKGDLRGARELQERVLETRRRVLGESHPETLTSMNNLASTLHAQGDLRGARELQERVLETQRRVLGESHPDTLRSTGNLASMLRAQGDLVAARELHEQVSKLLRRVFGEEHPDTLTSMNDLALTLRAQGELGGARELLGQVLEGRRRVLGEAHPDTLTSMNNLAVTLHAQGDLGGARELLERGVEGRRRVLGEAHPDTLASLCNLEMVLKAQGDHSGVQELGELRRRALGEPPDLEFRRIRLDNWMNFVHAEVAIQDRIFLVGPNASGKSNFLDAFRFLKDLASSGGGLQEAIRKRGGMDTLRSLAAPLTPTVTIRVELEEAGEETDQGRRWEYELAFRQESHGRPLIEMERVRRNGEWLLDRPDQDDRDDSARLKQTWLEQVNANREFRELAECFDSIRYLHIVPQIVREPGRSSGRVGDPFGSDFLDRMERTSAQARAARLRRIGEALRIAVPQLREIEITRDADGHPHLRG
ncbi:MAG: tetratricopeptide repeat protein, partial [Chromatiales bacterium]|nr:tetratricopeptide repeat protein [Chromatiales bacterium]